jgi:hypothetical protein
VPSWRSVKKSITAPIHHGSTYAPHRLHTGTERQA